MKYYCNPLDPNSTLNMDGGDIKPKRERMPQLKDTPKVHPSKKEEFEKLVVDILFVSGNTPLQEKKTDELYNWHISEMEKMLEIIKQECVKVLHKEKHDSITDVWVGDHYGISDCSCAEAMSCNIGAIEQSKKIYKLLNDLKEELK